MRLFVQTEVCRSRKHCETCLQGGTWREELAQHFDFNGACPVGMPIEQVPPAPIGLGDVVAKMIHAVTGKKPCPKCNKRKASLNRISLPILNR